MICLPFMQATASAHEIEQFTLKRRCHYHEGFEDPSDIGIPVLFKHYICLSGLEAIISL